MGNEAVLTKAAQQESGEIGLASSYRVIRYAASSLPEDYLGLIYSRWKRSLRYGNEYFRLVKPAAYYCAYDRYISRILSGPGATVRLAVLEDDGDVVLGFSVSRGSILDYVHVHKHQRRAGIGRSLVPAGIETITHLTNTGLRIWSNKYPEWAFNPFA